MDFVNTMSKEIVQLTDKIEEAQHFITSLKPKNNKREKEINKMAQKADELMQKLHELNDKAVKEKHTQFKNNKELNAAIGSRLLSYLLDSNYKKNLRHSMSLIQGFSRFDKDFFTHANKLVKIYEN